MAYLCYDIVYDVIHIITSYVLNAAVPESARRNTVVQTDMKCWIWTTTSMSLLMLNVNLTKNSCIQSADVKPAQKTISWRLLANLMK